MVINEINQRAQDYEDFIRAVYPVQHYTKIPFARSRYAFETLINTENGIPPLKISLGTAEVQIETIIFWLHKAMDKYLKIKIISSENLEELKILNIHLGACKSSSDLSEIIEKALKLTASLKI